MEHEGKRLMPHPVDPERNARRKRPPRGGPVAERPTRPVDFDPMRALGREAGEDDDDTDGGIQ